MEFVTKNPFTADRVVPGAIRKQRVSLKARLRGYGFAGVVSYGLLNTVYYVTAFLFFWTHVAKVPKGEQPVIHCSL